MGYNFTSRPSDMMKKVKSGKLLLASLCPTTVLTGWEYRKVVANIKPV